MQVKLEFKMLKVNFFYIFLYFPDRTDFLMNWTVLCLTWLDKALDHYEDMKNHVTERSGIILIQCIHWLLHCRAP